MFDKLDFENIIQLSNNFFDKIAKELLGNYILLINNNSYQIIEIEFYLNNTEGMLDSYTHKYKHEKYEQGQLRLHGAGIDIVIKHKNLYGGILIRGIKPLGKDIIRGPLKVVDEIIKNISFQQENIIHFSKLDKAREIVYIKSSREGLNFQKNKNIQGLKYLHKPWRYLVLPLALRAKNTFGKSSILFNLLRTKSDQEIEEIIPYDRATLENYKTNINLGKEMAESEIFKLDKSMESKAMIFGYCMTH